MVVWSDSMLLDPFCFWFWLEDVRMTEPDAVESSLLGRWQLLPRMVVNVCLRLMVVFKVRTQNMTLSYSKGKQTLCLVALAVWELDLSRRTVRACARERSLLG